MTTRLSIVSEATHRAKAQLDALTRDLRSARLQAGLSQQAVGRALGVSRALVGAWELGIRSPSPTEFIQWGAVIGLDVSIRAFAGGSRLRDTGQLRLLERFRIAVGDSWSWRTEVPVVADPRDRRAFDGLMVRAERRVGVEAVTRLIDSQGQSRTILLRQEAAGVDCMIMALADTRHNRSALVMASPTLGPAFPLPGRAAMSVLRVGSLPSANAIILI